MNLPNTEPSKKELAMAEQLIGSMEEKWEPAKWKDEYREALMKLIEEKVASPGKEVKASKASRKATNVVDLVSMLQQSINSQGKGQRKDKKSKHTSSHRKAA